MKKSYLTAKDVSDITGVKKAKVYEIIRGLREKSFDGKEPWGDTYEAQYIGKKVILVSIFIKAFPNAKAAIISISE